MWFALLVCGDGTHLDREPDISLEEFTYCTFYCNETFLADTLVSVILSIPAQSKGRM